MGNKKLLKLLIPLGIGAIISGFNYVGPELFAKADSNISISTIYDSSVFASNRVIINNSKLSHKIRTMLGKNSTENIFSNDFANHEDFAEKIINEGTADEEIITPTYQLDLSGTGITDIRELVQFEFPSNIKGINLCGNGITKDDVAKIIELLDCNKGDVLKIGDVEYPAQTDFKTQIKKVNLNNNNIDLNAISTSDTRLLFGIQNLPNPNNPMIWTGDNVKPQFYIRENVDENFLTFTFKHELSTNTDKKVFNTTPYNTVVSLIDDNPSEDKTNRYYIDIQSMPESDSAYFNNYSFHQEFVLFDVAIDPTFTVERKTLLNLDVSGEGKILEGSPLKLSGFGNGDSVHISYNNASTQFLTTSTWKNYVNITIAMRNAEHSRTIPVEFKVEDTINPIIKLKGPAHVYSSKNQDYIDPGIIAYDPISKDASSGDDMSSRVTTTSNVDVTTLGTYYITYTVSDEAGNPATATRIVEIQERALTKLLLRCNNDKIINGKDITLAVQLETGVDPSKYSTIKYYWYINDVLFITTTSNDKSTGLSTITNVIDRDELTIYVKCEATQAIDGAVIEVYSDKLTLKATSNISASESTILAVACAVLLIILVIAIITIVKYKKSHKKTHTKHKNFHKNKQPKINEEEKKNGDIQVIKDYNGPIQQSQPKPQGSDSPNEKEQPTIPPNTTDNSSSSGITSTPKDNSKFDPNDYR